MTDQHPLTDEMMRETFNPKFFTFSGEHTSSWYDEEAMRAAADWQLEQVINWIRCSPWVGSDCPIYDFEDEQDRLQLIADIKKAMRPTQENNND